MSDDDDKGKSWNPLVGMPPWAWVLLLGGGGTSLGIGGLSLAEKETEECPGVDDLAIATARAESAETSHRAMIDSLQSMALLLGECQTTRNAHGVDIR